MTRPSVMPRTRPRSSTPSVVVDAGSGSEVDNDSISHRSLDSTPPTSYNDSASATSQKSIDKMATDDVSVRSSRKRKSVNYNETALSHNMSKSRNTSGLTGKTLVHDGDEDEVPPLPKQSRLSEDSEAEVFPNELPPRPARASIKDRVKKVASRVGSVLGKRSREDAPKSKILKELDMGSGGLLDRIDLDALVEEEPARPAKRLKKSVVASAPVGAPTSVVPGKAARAGQRTKRWLTAGLYVGQQQDAKGGQKKLQKKTSQIQPVELPAKASFMPLPMFGYLEHTRDFTIPFDVFAPTFKRGDEKPKDWHQINKNRLVGEAKDIWEDEASLAISLCICRRPPSGEKSCGEDCLNRAMHYECDDNNCPLAPGQCSNRAFAELAQRVKKAGAFDVGVEVVKTPNRGFGVRACRAYAPGDIIMEYTGEIISEAECQRRMREVYSGKQSYYIMEFDQGLHIDGTKGSMARFVNHSCEPNCEVRMVKVSGKPRMAIFAGPDGVFTGQELTYDYNFDNFGTNPQACYCGAASCRGHLARRLNATEQKQKDKEDKERQRLAEIEAQKQAARAEKQKQVHAERGSGWIGWKTIKEVAAQLAVEKAARDESFKNSDRSKRREARNSGVPTKPEPIPTKRQRPKSVAVTADDIPVVASASAVGLSRFSEDLPRGGKTVTRKTEVLVTASVSETIVDEPAVLTTIVDETNITALPAIVSTDPDDRKSSKMLKSVKQVVEEGLRQGKTKLRQTTLSFGKMA